MTEYLFDFKPACALRVEASSHQEAVAKLRAVLDMASVNFGAWPNGDPVVGEVTLNHGDELALTEIDGEEPVICPSCGAIEGEPEWRTVGDGYGGYCPQCANARS